MPRRTSVDNSIVAVLIVDLLNGLFMNWYGNQQGEGYEYPLLALALAVAIMIHGACTFFGGWFVASKGQRYEYCGDGC